MAILQWNMYICKYSISYMHKLTCAILSDTYTYANVTYVIHKLASYYIRICMQTASNTFAITINIMK